jgi:hypothetical protein
MLLGKGHECQHVRFGVIEKCGQLGQLSPDLIGD